MLELLLHEGLPLGGLMKKYILFYFLVFILSSALVSLDGCSSDEAVIQLDGERFLQDPPADVDNGQPVCTTNVSDESMEITEPVSVTVYICGAVKNPGVYTLDSGLRIVDAINAACGLREDADECYVNQATLLEDGQRIYVPTKEETGESREVLLSQDISGAPADDIGMVNINTADISTLMTLPGIGEAKATLIIEYRTKNGKFKSIEDIMKISGIKEGMFNRIKDRICI